MQITLNVLLFRYASNINFEFQNIELSRTIEALQLFDEEVLAHTSGNYLYIISEQELRHYEKTLFANQAPPSCLFCCICPDRNVHIDFFDSELSMLLLYTDKSFSATYNQLASIIREFSEWDQEFSLALLQKLPLQTLLDISHNYITHPMVILDRHFTLLGYVTVPGERDSMMDSILSSGYVTPQMMARLQQEKLISSSEKAANPLISYYCYTNHECYYSMMYRFQANNHIVGYALVFRCKIHPKTNYLYLMNMITANLQLYFQQDRYILRSSSDMYEALFCEIMEYPDASKQQYEDQIGYIPDLSLNGRYQLALVDYQNYIELPYSFACWNLRNSISALKPFVYQNHLYVLRTLSEEDDFVSLLPEDQDAQFRQCLRDYPYTVGVSGVFFSLLELPVAGKQCREALKLGKYKDKQSSDSPARQRYYFFNHLQAEYLLAELENQGHLSMISSPWYTVLKEYDTSHNTDLCDVLMAYLQNGRNINQTSTALFMHRNTVLNKVKKATGIIHSELEDPQYLLSFFLAYIREH